MLRAIITTILKKTLFALLCARHYHLRFIKGGYACYLSSHSPSFFPQDIKLNRYFS